MTKLPRPALRAIWATTLTVGLLLLGPRLASAAGYPGDGGGDGRQSESGGGARPLASSPCGGKFEGDQGPMLLAPRLHVLPDTPAEAAGLEDGDEIVAVGGQQVGRDGTLSELIAAHAPGDRVSLDIRSGDSDATRSVDVTLGQHPDQPGRAYLGVTTSPRFAIKVAPGAGAPRWRHRPGGEEKPQSEHLGETAFSAAAVVAVVPDGPAAFAGVDQGDSIVTANGDPVESPADVARILMGVAPGDSVRLEIRKPGGVATKVVDVVAGSRPDDPQMAFLGMRLGRVMTFQFGMDGPDLGRGPGSGAVPGVIQPGQRRPHDVNPAGKDASGADWQRRYRSPRGRSASRERSA